MNVSTPRRAARSWVRITLAKPSLYGVKQGNPLPRRYRAPNLLEELDQPGEFYLDHTAGALYFWPPAALDGARVELSALRTPVLALKDVEWVTLRGFTVEAGLGNGIEMSGGRSNAIVACRVRNVRQAGSRAAHNLIHDAPHQAVALQGNDHLFEYNVVRNVVTETDDAGALYKGRNPSCRGNVIRYNLFIDCRRALGLAPWGDQRWKETVEGGRDCHGQRLLLEDVDITRPPYTTRYPELRGFMNPQPGEARVNHGRNNVLFRCGEVSSGNWKHAADELWATDEDPGFVDAFRGDFRLRSDAEVYKRLPGFQPIPFEKIGLLGRRAD